MTKIIGKASSRKQPTARRVLVKGVTSTGGDRRAFKSYKKTR